MGRRTDRVGTGERDGRVLLIDTQKQIIEVEYRSAAAERAATARSENEQRRLKADAAAAKREAEDVLKSEWTTAKQRAEARAYLANETKKAAAETEKALKKQQQGWEQQTNTIIGAAKQVASFSAAMVGLNSAATVMGTILERFQKIRDASVDGTNRMIDQAAKMRSLAFMAGVSPSMMQAKITGIAAKTFQTPEEATQLYEGAMARGAGAIKAGLISEQEFAKAVKYQGQHQFVIGKDAKALGSLLGMMPGFSGKKGQTANEIEGLNERIIQLVKLGGWTDYGTAAGQLERTSPFVRKGIYTPQMAMALTSAYAASGVQEEASTTLEQATRAVSIGMLRNRGMKVLPEEQDQFMRSAAYMHSLTDRAGNKLTDMTAPEEKMLAVVRDVIRAEDAFRPTKPGEKFQANVYLGHKGFVNDRDMMALASLAGLERTGQLAQLIDLGRKAITPHKEGAPVEGFEEMLRDPVGATWLPSDRRNSHLKRNGPNFGSARFRCVRRSPDSEARPSLAKVSSRS